MTDTMTFQDLEIGDGFEFKRAACLSPYSLARGPWIKTSPRKYKRADGGPENPVGTVKDEVIRG